MKKIIALVLAAMMMLFAVACANTNDDKNNGVTDTTDAVTTEDTTVEPAQAPAEFFNACTDKFYEAIAPAFGMEAADIKAANFFCGGYYGEDDTTVTQGVAGATPLDDETALSYFKMLSLVSDETLAKIDEAALFQHSMWINQMSVSIMHVADSANVDGVADAMKATLIGDPAWDCGFPEQFFVAKVGDYVISAYGGTDSINGIKTAVTETFADAVVVLDQEFRQE